MSPLKEGGRLELDKIDVSLIFVGSKPTFWDRESCMEKKSAGLPDLHFLQKKTPNKSSVFNTWSMRR